ncbi:MAG TPA: zinc ribbon domain-containing protein [Mycobacterium sp.]|nr:zinc ribbon domain-containing protein [Mycobacterium sp.]
MVLFAVLRWQPPLIAISALGLPLLFVFYLRESDAYVDLPRGSLILTAVTAAGFGTGWAWATGAIIARSYDVAFGAGFEYKRPLWEGLAIPVLGALLMLAPTALARLSRVGTRESLDGFLFGTVAAMCFTAAATVTWLAPQFETGMMADDRPIGVLMAEAGIRGVAMSLTAAAAGGMVGAALWFARPDREHQHPGQWLANPAFAVPVVLLAYAALGLVDVVQSAQYLQLVFHLVVAALMTFALRLVLHMALLREPHDPITNEPVACSECGTVGPHMAFCPNCGIASRASSRSSRAARKNDRPARQTSHPRLLLQLGVGAAVLIVAAGAAVKLLTPPTQRYVCPPDCGQPPMGKPVDRLPRFTPAGAEFSVAYPGEGTAYRVTMQPDGVTADYTGGDGGTMQLFGQPAAGRSPTDIAKSLMNEAYPDAVTDYTIPNAMVGYQLGYGEVADVYPQDSAGTFTRLRVLVMVSVKNDFALIAAAMGPYHRFTPTFGTGQPSGANFELALDMAKYVNSFMWRGDPAR